MKVDIAELEATGLAVIAVEESGGDPARAIAALAEGMADLDPDERKVAERAQQIIRDRGRT